MAGPNLTVHIPIHSVISKSGQVPLTQAQPEKAAQTFKEGVPLQMAAGFMQQWDGATLAAAIAGFSMFAAQNLPTNGAGAPGAFTQVGSPGTIQTYGNILNQPGAVKIAVGAPMADGRSLYEVAEDGTIFEAQYDNSAGTTASTYTPTQAMIGTQFGLTTDASGQFYLDGGKTTAGTNTVAVLVGINPIDGPIVNARVRFQLLAAARQIIA